jgi:hypothetical protein
MLNWIKQNLISFEFSLRLYAQRSVATITEDLQRTVKELEAHAEERLKKSFLEEAKIAAAAKARGEHLDEHQKAVGIAAKIGALIS